MLDNKVEKELTNLHSFLQHNKKYKDKYELAQKNDDEELFNSVIDAHREKHAARKKEINEKYDWWEDIDLNDCNSILKDKMLNSILRKGQPIILSIIFLFKKPFLSAIEPSS